MSKRIITVEGTEADVAAKAADMAVLIAFQESFTLEWLESAVHVSLKGGLLELARKHNLHVEIKGDVLTLNGVPLTMETFYSGDIRIVYPHKYTILYSIAVNKNTTAYVVEVEVFKKQLTKK